MKLSYFYRGQQLPIQHIKYKRNLQPTQRKQSGFQNTLYGSMALVRTHSPRFKNPVRSVLAPLAHTGSKASIADGVIPERIVSRSQKGNCEGQALFILSKCECESSDCREGGYHSSYTGGRRQVFEKEAWLDLKHLYKSSRGRGSRREFIGQCKKTVLRKNSLNLKVIS